MNRLPEKLFGRPLRTDEEHLEEIGPLSGVPVLGLDALASASYGPEAALTAMLALGSIAATQIIPITATILALLVFLFISYHQTIAAYPSGGGSFTVANENLGPAMGQLAASALCVDYILNAAVAISAGVGAMVSVVPPLLPYTLPLCLGVLALLTIANLRGVRSAGVLFMIPTYGFIACLATTILVGLARLLGSHPVDQAQTASAAKAGTTAAVSSWLWLRAFASGCTAMTGVEAVSNAVPLFRQPRVRLAQRTLLLIVLALGFLLMGVALLTQGFHIVATKPGAPGYQSVLSQIISAVAGRGVFYFLSMSAVLAVLGLSANTSFADFPRVCRVLATEGYLPPEFARRGSRLVYTAGILTLALITGVLLVIFGGVTDHLIPLFAVGAFLAFTMSQFGMVVHWRRSNDPGRMRKMLINGAGAMATSVVLVVIAVTKFREGAWLTVIVISGFVLLFRATRRYNQTMTELTSAEGELEVSDLTPPLVVIPLRRLDRVGRKALCFALTITREVHVVQVRADEMNTEELERKWQAVVQSPLEKINCARPKLHIVHSSYREFYGRFLTWLRKFSHQQSGRHIIVLIPELVHRRWYQFILNHRATRLKALLLLQGNSSISVMSTPWYASAKKQRGKEKSAA